MTLAWEIKNLLAGRGAAFVRYVDVTGLPREQTQNFPRGIVLGMALDKNFLAAVARGETIEKSRDDFVEKELAADTLADWLAALLAEKGYEAYSQSEAGNLRAGRFDEKTHTSALPHKTIARHGGLGFLGKNNLLITKEYGCGFSMATVLTNAPLPAENQPLAPSRCGSCDACVKACKPGALLGKEWTPEGGRDAVVDAYRCRRCVLACMVACPWTQAYVNRP